MRKFFVALVGLYLVANDRFALAEFHGVITGTTNYIGRGYTKSQNSLAIQANLDYQHASGGFVGTSVASVNFGDHNYANYSTIEMTPYVGFTYQVADVWRVDIQASRYLYDGKIFNEESDYNEFYLFVHYRDLITIRAGILDNYYNKNVLSGDYEAMFQYPLTGYLDISGGVGYSQVKKALKWDFIYWHVGLTARYQLVSADLRYVQSEYTTPFYALKSVYDPDILPATVVFSLSLGF